MDYKLLLYELTAGVKEWEGQFHKIPRKILKGQQLLINGCALNQVEPPTDLSMLMRMLRQPIEEWGIPQLTEIYPKNASIITPIIGISEEAEDFLSYYKHPDEEENMVVKKILAYCRKHALQEEYVSIRTFLSKSQNAVLSAIELLKFRRQITHPELAELFIECYEKIPHLSNFKKCPHCGWTLVQRDGAWRCNKDYTCRQLSNFTEVMQFSYENEKIYRMKSGIQKYTLLPGIAEEKIAEKLIKKGFSITMYPEVDQDDIAVHFGETTIYLDVKDYRNPYTLAQYLIEKNPPSTSWYVIPSYHEENFSSYQQQVEQYLHEHDVTYQIVMENELIKKLERWQHVETI